MNMSAAEEIRLGEIQAKAGKVLEALDYRIMRHPPIGREAIIKAALTEAVNDTLQLAADTAWEAWYNQTLDCGCGGMIHDRILELRIKGGE